MGGSTLGHSKLLEIELTDKKKGGLRRVANGGENHLIFRSHTNSSKNDNL